MSTWLTAGGIFAATILSVSVVCAQGVEEIAPDALQERIAGTVDGKPLVVHYTSDDGSCSYCVDNNATVLAAAEQLSDNYDFVSLTFNPWRQLFETEDGRLITEYQASQGLPLFGLPAVVVFDDGEAFRAITGSKAELIQALSEVYTRLRNENPTVRGDVRVAHIPPSQVATYVEAFSADKPVVLTLSSLDENCPHCLTGNDAIARASRYLSDDFVFARVDFDPWDAFVKEPDISAYLDRFDLSVKGLPTSLVFYQNTFAGTLQTNGDDLVTVLPKALDVIKGGRQ